MEDIMPDIVKREKAFYARRTQGEKLQYLRDITGIKEYGSATTRTDEFNNIYMGRDYGGRAYEILSMGIEMIWLGHYNTTVDTDYSAFIIGLLLGL
jgi:hypothetical protein